MKTLAAVNLDSAGTAEQLSASSVYARSVTVTSHPDNSGRIWVGDSDVAVNRGVPIEPGEDVVITPEHLGLNREALLDISDLYFDGATTGDDALVTYIVDKSVFS